MHFQFSYCQSSTAIENLIEVQMPRGLGALQRAGFKGSSDGWQSCLFLVYLLYLASVKIRFQVFFLFLLNLKSKTNIVEIIDKVNHSANDVPHSILQINPCQDSMHPVS